MNREWLELHSIEMEKAFLFGDDYRRAPQREDYDTDADWVHAVLTYETENQSRQT